MTGPAILALFGAAAIHHNNILAPGFISGVYDHGIEGRLTLYWENPT
jgi:fructose-specific phosphotransferase system IIC component